MRSFTITSALTAAVVVNSEAIQTTADVARRDSSSSAPAVSASGTAFWQGSTRFYVRGMGYQPGGSSKAADPLADKEVCDRDIANFKDLGINTIRVYTVDNSKDHDYCMGKLADAGISLMLDVNTPKSSINRNSVKDAHLSYNDKYLQNVFATIDKFAKYDNTMGFFSGNEVINNSTNTNIAPYVKAVTRDMRNYINKRGYRKIPVGYSAADVSENRWQTALYFNCGTDDERSDFFAFNDYSWCDSDYKKAGWGDKMKQYADYGLPMFLSEYGCITNGRDFNELSALMDPDKMTSVMSGGFMYEYMEEGSGYGIVNQNGKPKDKQFKAFKDALAKYPAPSGDGGAAKTTKSNPCPTKDADWEVDSTLLPSMPKKAQDYMNNGAGKANGLTVSSQGGGSSSDKENYSDGDASPGEGAVSSTNSPDSASGLPMAPLDKSIFILSGLIGSLTLVGALLL